MPDGPVAEIPYQYSEAMINQTERAYVPTPTPTPVVTQAADSSDSGSESQSLSASATATMVDSLFVPYQDARIKATSTETSGVECARITIVVNGSAEACQAMIDDLCTKPALRITGFEWDDVDYVEKCTLMMDIRIIWMTIKQVLAREDVGVASSGTNDFNDYREREWIAQGRQDLIDKAREEVRILK
jgi:hypothetical protein